MDDTLTGEEINELQNAILKAYPQEEDLTIVLKTYANEDYDAIKTGINYKTRIFNLIKHFDAQNDNPKLIKAVWQERQNNDTLKKYAEQFKICKGTAQKKEDKIFPKRVNSCLVMNRRFIENEYDKLLDQFNCRFLNIYGSTDSGKSFCCDIIRDINHKRQNQSVIMYLIRSNTFKFLKSQKIREILSDFEDFVEDVCQKFGIRLPQPKLSQEESKWERTISQGISHIYNNCHKEKNKNFIFLIDTEESLKHEQARFILKEIVLKLENCDNLKIIFCSINPIESYQDFELSCSHKDFLRQCSKIDLDQRLIKKQDVVDCLKFHFQSYIDSDINSLVSNIFKEAVLESAEGNQDVAEIDSRSLRRVGDYLNVMINKMEVVNGYK